MSEAGDDLNEPVGDRKTMVFKLHFEKPPEFTITYNDKEDLFHSFQSELEKWSATNGVTYWLNSHGDKVKVDDADTLFKIANDGTQAVSVTVCDEAGDSDSQPEYSEAIQKRKKKKGHRTDRGPDHSRGGAPSHSRPHPCGGRSRSGDISDEEDFQECCGHCPPYHEPPFLYRPPYMRPPMFCPCTPFHYPMDTRFSSYPFFEMGRGRGGYHPHHGGMRGHFHGY